MFALDTLTDDTIFSVSDLLKLAQLCNATYAVKDNKTVVEELGMTYVTDLKDISCPVTIATWNGYKICSFQGTRATDNVDITQLWDDVDNTVIHISDMRVHGGFWQPMSNVMPEILKAMNPLEGTVILTGHSLGGVRSHLAKAFFPDSHVVSFGAPKGADDIFWKKYYTGHPPIRIVHEKDFAPGWPYDGPWTHPSKLTWLHNNTMSLIENRTGGLQISLSDHSINNGYIFALSQLVNSNVTGTIVKSTP